MFTCFESVYFVVFLWFKALMSIKKEDIGNRIRQAREQLNLGQEELGRLTKTSKQSVSSYEIGRSYPPLDFLAALATMCKISLDQLITGINDRPEPDSPPKKSEGPTASPLEIRERPGKQRTPSNAKMGNFPVETEEAGRPNYIDESFSLTEMVTMTIEVLESKTVYRSALASNVRAFHQAVKMEGEMQGVKEEVSAMRNENRTMAERMERMEQLLLSLGGTVPEKRDKKANA